MFVINGWLALLISLGLPLGSTHINRQDTMVTIQRHPHIVPDPNQPGNAMYGNPTHQRQYTDWLGHDWRWQDQNHMWVEYVHYKP